VSNHSRSWLSALAHSLVEHRLILSLGLSIASGLVLESMLPLNPANPMLRLIALQRP
jgi:hypothetical protein